MTTAERRQHLKEALILAAERVIEARGVAGLKARDLASEAGCSLGAIYNVFSDMDDLILSLNSRMLVALERELGEAANAAPKEATDDVERAVAQMQALAEAYLNFAAANTARWRAMFDHSLRGKEGVPEWYFEQQKKLFAFVEVPLRLLKPGMESAAMARLARSVFSAVHGVVLLGLEEKLGDISPDVLRGQIQVIVEAMGRGLSGK